MVECNVTRPRGIFLLRCVFVVAFSSVVTSPLPLTFILDDDGLYILATAQNAHTRVTHASNIILN